MSNNHATPFARSPLLIYQVTKATVAMEFHVQEDMMHYYVFNKSFDGL